MASSSMPLVSAETQEIMMSLLRSRFPTQRPKLVAYAKDISDDKMDQLVAALFPTEGDTVRINLEKLFQESVVWLKWIMFNGDPATVKNFGGGGVCGAGAKLAEVRYKCLDCERHSKGVVCSDCFERGGHQGHDYSIVITGGGYCDCGDVELMQSTGFCPDHRGNKHMQPLPSEIGSSMTSILDSLFKLLKGMLVPLSRTNGEVQRKFTDAVLELLLGLCDQSRNIGLIISERMLSSPDLMKILVKEDQLSIFIVEKVRILLVKLLMLGDLRYQHGFAKVFWDFFQTGVNTAVDERMDELLVSHPTLRDFSLQIVIRPALTLQLVKEDDLLYNLVSKSLHTIFKSCEHADGRLEIARWKGLYYTTIRVIESIEFIMKHSDVVKYVIREQKDTIRTWMRILRCYVQGVNPHLRQAGGEPSVQVEPFVLGHCLAKIHSHLVGGALSEEVEKLEDSDSERRAKSPRTSQEVSVSRLTGTSTAVDTKSIPSSLSWLISECVKNIDSWLVAPQRTGGSGSNETSTDDLQVLSSSEWTCPLISQDISVHIPLHRMLSVALHRSFSKYSGESLDDFFSNVLRGCHRSGFSASIMEHPLRIWVLCAQEQAGMWNTNEDGAAFSCQSYQRTSSGYEIGLELDLFLLQCCAAFAPESDLFVKRIMESYDLCEYLNLCSEGSIDLRFEHVLVQEMLKLMIQIVQERRFCGQLTTDECCLRREIVRVLSVKDIGRVELKKSIPKDLPKDDKMFEDTLESVATRSKPDEFKPVKYKLLKECWTELDLYHPRWVAEDLQSAEERYFRRCKKSALTDQSPRWKQTYPLLDGISRIATCKKTVEIIRAVLFHFLFLNASRAPMALVRIALHLLSLALDICSQRRAAGLTVAPPVLEFAGEEISAAGHGNESLVSLLIALRIHEDSAAEGTEDSSLSSLCVSILKMFRELEPQLIPAGVGEEDKDDARKAEGKKHQAAAQKHFADQQAAFMEAMGTDVPTDDDDDDGDEKCSLCKL